MKTRTTLPILFLLIFAPVISSFGQKVDFSGEWKLNKEKTTLTDNSLFLSGIKIMLRSDSLLTTRAYENSNGEEYTFDENLSLDGKEGKIVIYNMPRTSKVSKAAGLESLIFESVTVFTGQYGADSLVSKETWKLDPESKNLVIEFTNKMTGNEMVGKIFFNKVK
jgi:hypothetical protein